MKRKDPRDCVIIEPEPENIDMNRNAECDNDDDVMLPDIIISDENPDEEVEIDVNLLKDNDDLLIDLTEGEKVNGKSPLDVMDDDDIIITEDEPSGWIQYSIRS